METQILKFWQKYFQVFEFCLQGMMVNHYEKKIFFKLSETLLTLGVVINCFS